MAERWFEVTDWRETVTPVEVESSTPKRVKLVGGQQRDRETRSCLIAPTFAEAKAWLEVKLTRKVASYESSLTRYRSALAKVQSLTEPETS